jgi:hypothetical protein
MPPKCIHCAIDPSSHSLVKLNDYAYYTKPSQAKMYYDADSIVQHYRAELPLDKEWMWIFDADGFGVKHLLHADVGIKLAKLISSEYKDNLVKIRVVNANVYVNTVYAIIKPFLSTRIIEKIEFVNT